MSMEQQLRESFEAQVGSPPAVHDLADRSLRGVRLVRRRRAVVVVTAAVAAAVAVPLMTTARNTSRTPAVPATQLPATGSAVPLPSSTATPASSNSSASAAATVKEPGVDYTTEGILRRAAGSTAASVDLPRHARALYMTEQGTVVLAKTNNPQLDEIYLVHPDGKVDTIVKAADIVGIAVEGSRLAYSGGPSAGHGLPLVLMNLATGKEIKRLEVPMASTPVAFVPQGVLLANGELGSESGLSTWVLKTNTYTDWSGSGGDFGLDALGGIALVAEGDHSCVAIVNIATHQPRFHSCLPGVKHPEFVVFDLLAPDAKRYVGSGSSSGNYDDRWPVLGDATTGVEDHRLRQVFADAGFTVTSSVDHPIVWEDNSHILVNSRGAYGEYLIVRCDVDTATCEEAVNYGGSEAGIDIMLSRRV
ncbi:MAG: hypothetical protein ABI912_11675 [Actinomycetota bacterium]